MLSRLLLWLYRQYLFNHVSIYNIILYHVQPLLLSNHIPKSYDLDIVLHLYAESSLALFFFPNVSSNILESGNNVLWGILFQHNHLEIIMLEQFIHFHSTVQEPPGIGLLAICN